MPITDPEMNPLGPRMNRPKPPVIPNEEKCTTCNPAASQYIINDPHFADGIVLEELQ